MTGLLLKDFDDKVNDHLRYGIKYVKKEMMIIDKKMSTNKRWNDWTGNATINVPLLNHWKMFKNSC